MFGYVTVFKPELKIKEYEAYKGVYCTLCKEMGKEYGLFSRFLLSYDGAFYVMYKMGISKECISAEKSHCSFNPCKKCMKITCNNNVYKLASTITVILAYFKLIDNLHDSNFFKKLLLYIIYPYFAFLKNKALNKYPDIFDTIKKSIYEQFENEKDSNAPIDKYADSSAKMLAWLFSYGESEENFELSHNFGYHLGRVVYFLDAFDDYKTDIKENSFNPFINSDNFLNDAVEAINLSNGFLAESLSKHNFSNFKEIIENVILEGINFQTERIVNKHRRVKNDESL